MVVHPDIHYRVANAKDGCGKTDWYDLLHPSRAIIGTRDRKVHDLRRRLWENACDANSKSDSSTFDIPRSANSGLKAELSMWTVSRLMCPFSTTRYTGRR